LLCVDGNFLAVHNLSQSALCVAALGLTHRTAKLSSTGATSGIGNVAAKTLAKMGARIVVVARDKSRDSEVELSVCEQRQRELARDRLDRLRAMIHHRRICNWLSASGRHRFTQQGQRRRHS
jgi:predicted amino acid dehydrogenase